MSTTNRVPTLERAEPGSSRSRRPRRLGNFDYPQYPYRRPPELEGRGPTRHPVIIVGGGMVGLTAAVDMASKGVRCVLLDDNDTVSAGSRSIAQARRTMEIWSRLGCAEPMRAKGISWSKGHTHHGERCVLSFEVFPEGTSRFPSFTSLAQYYVEHFLVEKAATLANLELRWLHKVLGVVNSTDHVQLRVSTPDGEYELDADWVIAADGARSAVRECLRLDFPGERLRDKFVIADVKLPSTFPFERNFWFDPPFYDGNTVLRVPQSDGVWRVDWQIDTEADVDAELAPATVQARLERMFGSDAGFEAEWVSTYASELRVMDKFRHGRVFFAGDAAHQLSPFGGGRGGNSGVQDADNLVWKIAAVVKGHASPKLLETYECERRPIAVRNIDDARLSTEFITPKNEHSLALRNAVFALASAAPFAKVYINTGRFAVWPVLENSPLSVPETDAFTALAKPGTPALDCPLYTSEGTKVWLGDMIGDAFSLVLYGEAAVVASDELDEFATISRAVFPLKLVRVSPRPGEMDTVHDLDGVFARQYDAAPSAAYLFRPDQHVLARWRHSDVLRVKQAMIAALGEDERSSDGLGA